MEHKVLLLSVAISVVVAQSGCELYTGEEEFLNAETLTSANEEVAAPSMEVSNVPVTGARFVWKPVSESDGRLVVLLPNDLTGKVVRDQVVISRDNRGTDIIEKGRFVGDDDNGYREHYRFNGPGSAYGTNIYLHIVMKDGEGKYWHIPNGGSRVDGPAPTSN